MTKTQQFIYDRLLNDYNNDIGITPYENLIPDYNSCKPYLKPFKIRSLNAQICYLRKHVLDYKIITVRNQGCKLIPIKHG